MTNWMLLLGLLAVGCAKPAELSADGGSGSAESGGRDGDEDGSSATGGSVTGGEATGGEVSTPDGTGGKKAVEATGGTASGGEPPDETGGTENAAGQGPTETGGAPPAESTDEALYGKLELTYAPSGTTQFVLDLTNASGRDLNTAGIEIRYWFTPEGAIADAVCECYSVQGSITTCDDVTRTFVEGPPAYLRITFDVPSTWKFWGFTDTPSKVTGLQIAIHRMDYQNDDMTNDYSYQSTSGSNDKLTVYYDGTLVWGVEPEA